MGTENREKQVIRLSSPYAYVAQCGCRLWPIMCQDGVHVAHCPHTIVYYANGRVLDDEEVRLLSGVLEWSQPGART